MIVHTFCTHTHRCMTHQLVLVSVGRLVPSPLQGLGGSVLDLWITSGDGESEEGAESEEILSQRMLTSQKDQALLKVGETRVFHDEKVV